LRCAHAVLRYSQVGNTEEEQIATLELQIAEIQRAIAGIIEYCNLDGMRAVRKDLLRNEVALRVNRNLAARYPDRVACRYTAAVYLHSAAAERNALARQIVLAVGGQQCLRCRRIRLHQVFR